MRSWTEGMIAIEFVKTSRPGRCSLSFRPSATVGNLLSMTLSGCAKVLGWCILMAKKPEITARAPILAGAALRRPMKRDPDQRVRRRSRALPMVAEGAPLLQMAYPFQTSPCRIRAWRARFLAHGRRGQEEDSVGDILDSSLCTLKIGLVHTV
jgi:hypothetical protein